MKILTLSILLLLFIFTMACSEPKKEAPKPKLRLTVLFNNIKGDNKLKTEWGFSCLIEGLAKTILFDTGLKGDILLANMEKLNINPGKPDLVFLTHFHGDHTNGLAKINEKNSNVQVYMPASFPDSFKEKVKGFPINVKDVTKSQEIFNGVYTTGEMGSSIIEQSMVIDWPRGAVLIAGCAHPGIVEITKKAKQIIGKEICFVIGGFHLAGKPIDELNMIIESLKKVGVKRVAPTHCTGEQAMELFKAAFGDNYVEAGIGAVIEL